MKFFWKMLAALVMAVIVANGFCYVYFNTVHSVTNGEGYTVSKFKPNELAIYAIEGFSLKKTDRYGFYNDGTVSPDNANVVCIGSSQTEALQVGEDKSYVAQLNKIDSNKLNVYNLGVSGQFIQTTLPRLPLIPKYFTATQVIVLETPRLPNIGEWKKIREILNSGEVPIEDLDWKEQNLAYKLFRQIPLLRICRKQMSDLNKKHNVKNTDVECDGEYRRVAEETLETLRKKMGDIRIIIVYLPQVKLNKNGEMSIISDMEMIMAMKDACASNGIEYLDMCPVYSKAYATERIVPYGHFNSHVATGHLNAEGHRLLAGALYDKIVGEGLGR